MDNALVRLANLELLIDEAGNARKLADRINSNPGYISQLRKRRKTAEGKPRKIGDSIARRLESAMDKPSGWMDVDHDIETLSEDELWVARAFGRLSRQQRENFVFMLRGSLQKVAPEMLENAPIYHNKKPVEPATDETAI